MASRDYLDTRCERIADKISRIYPLLGHTMVSPRGTG
jgi:hypothetical protein